MANVPKELEPAYAPPFSREEKALREATDPWAELQQKRAATAGPEKPWTERRTPGIKNFLKQVLDTALPPHPKHKKRS